MNISRHTQCVRIAMPRRGHDKNIPALSNKFLSNNLANSTSIDTRIQREDPLTAQQDPATSQPVLQPLSMHDLLDDN